MFNKAALFAYDDKKIEKVKCPEWGKQGKEIYVRTMSGKARDNYEMGIVRASDVEEGEKIIYNMRAEMAIACCCDKKGKLLFTPADADMLGNMSCAPLDRIFDVAKRLSRLEAKDVKEMEKSLESDQS